MLRLRRIVAPDPDHLTVTEGNTPYRIAVRRRPGSRRMTLRVSGSTGEIALSLPPRAAIGDAQRFVDAHAGWIASRLARVPDRIAFAAGAMVPLRGVPHRIVHRFGTRNATRAVREGEEAVIAVAGDEASISGRLRRFLVAEAQRDLVAAVSRHADALGLTASRITIRDTRSRWGSCSSAGALSFSWRLILAPPFVLDYLAAHECAHLKELNHSHRFWTLVHGLCPATDEAEAWLKRHGTGLHRFG